MHATLTELLENFKSGLLWVQADGVVRYANADATAMTGLTPGRKLYDPELRQAVARAVSQQAIAELMTPSTRPAAGGSVEELRCRVLPGLSRDDAFVLLADEAGTHGAAFANLLAVVRTDLRDPLRDARTALADPQAARAALADRLGEVLEVLDKLVDLADVWASDALLESERIEPWPLLQQVWQDVGPLAAHRSITVRFDAHDKDVAALAAIYGSPTWLARVFRECLEQAVRMARPGNTLVIDYRQLGPRALIVFRDSGAFAGQSASAVAMRPQRSAAPSRTEARAQIGFKLCQHIVGLHGGRLREEQEDGLRNLLIDLPTGAPHRTDDARLDVAQAQQYARDLAALMARARTPH